MSCCKPTGLHVLIKEPKSLWAWLRKILWIFLNKSNTDHPGRVIGNHLFFFEKMITIFTLHGNCVLSPGNQSFFIKWIVSSSLRWRGYLIIVKSIIDSTPTDFAGFRIPIISNQGLSILTIPEIFETEINFAFIKVIEYLIHDNLLTLILRLIRTRL